MKTLIILLCSLLSTNSNSGALTSPTDLIIREITIIDGTGAPQKPMSVAIRSGRIVEIGKNIAAPEGTTIIDGKGRYLMPGLWDMHAHLAGLEIVPTSPEIFISYGVTGIRDMGGHLKDLLSVRDQIESGHRIGPTLLMAGSTLNGSQEADFHRVVKTPEEVPAVIEELKKAGVNFIKIHNQTSPEVFFAISTEAKAHGLDFAGHVPFGVSLSQASNVGMKSIEHIQVLLETISYQEENPAKGIPDALDRLFGEDGKAAFHSFVRNGTAHTPTLVAYREFASSFENPEKRTQAEALFKKLIELTGFVHRSGVRILAGTDLSSDPGESLHDELELLVQAGLTPMEALRSATLWCAETLGIARETGSVEVGKRADLILLDADPLADIRNTRKISLVILDGRLISREELKSLRESK